MDFGVNGDVVQTVYVIDVVVGVVVDGVVVLCFVAGVVALLCALLYAR